MSPQPAVEWATNLLAENGNALIGVGTVSLVAVWCGFRALGRRIERRAESRRSQAAIDELQQYANDPTTRAALDQTWQARKETP